MKNPFEQPLANGSAPPEQEKLPTPSTEQVGAAEAKQVEAAEEQEPTPAEKIFMEFRKERLDAQWELNEERMKENPDEDRVVELDQENRAIDKKLVKENDALINSGSNQRKILEIIDKNMQDPKWQKENKSSAKEWYFHKIKSELEKVYRAMKEVFPGMLQNKRKDVISEKIQPALESYESIKKQSQETLTSLTDSDFEMIEKYLKQMNQLKPAEEELLKQASEKMSEAS